MISIQIPENAEKILAMLKEHGFDAYVVGGCVRDSLLGRVPGDWDITTEAKPAQIKEVFRRTIDTGIEHGTVTVRMKGGSYEVTTYRIDGDYSDRRHPDSVTFTSDLKEDLRRRDFTINAMAWNPRAGLVDVFGGMEDLRRRIIRCVGSANERFDEDALRVLRAVRFAAQLDFTIEPETYEAIRLYAPGLEQVSRERILTELNKTLCAAHPEMLRLLFDTGADRYISPELTAAGETAAADLAASAQRQGAAALTPEKHLRWSAFLKDMDAAPIRQLLEGLKSDNDTRDKVLLLTAELRKPLPRTASRARRLLHAVGPERYDDLMALKRAGYGLLPGDDCGLAQTLKDRVLADGDCYELKTLALKGADLIALGVKPGPQLGGILNRLLDHVLEDPSVNTREKLTELVQEEIRRGEPGQKDPQ